MINIPILSSALSKAASFSLFPHFLKPSRLLNMLLTVFLLSGCVQLPENRTITVDLGLSETHETETETVVEWWTEFQQPQLDLLIDEALGENFTLKTAQARVLKAAAVFDSEGSRRYPTLSADFEPGYSYNHESRVSTTANDASLKASWELDLWGKQQLNTDIAYFNLLSIEERFTTSQQALAGDVARQWYLLHEQVQVMKLLAKQIDNTQKITAISEQRFRYAQESISAVWRQQQLLESLESQYNDAGYRLTILEKQMNILLGKSPNAPIDWQYSEAITIPSPAIAVFSTELLHQRPDIRQAWYDYMGEHHNIGVAKAAQLPNISLSGGLRTDEIDNLLDIWKLDLGLRFNVPIFNAGRLAADLEQAEASADIAFFQYTQVVLEAIQEVEVGLIEVDRQHDSLNSIDVQTQHAEKILDMELVRYTRGIQSYLDVLNAQERLFSLQKQQLSAERQALHTHISLYQSIGGRLPTSPAIVSDKAV